MRGRALAATLLVAAGCAREPRLATTTVRQGAFEREVLADGYLKAARSTPLIAPQDAQGRLRVIWIADDGSPVRAGEVVARFDDTPWRKDLTDALGERSSAELKRDKHAVAAQASIETAELEAGLARGELAQAERFQARDDELYSRHERIESELDAELARQRESHALGVRGIKQRVERGEGELLSIERRKADLKVERAEKGLASLELTAEHDGLLILVRDWRGTSVRIGDSVWPGQSIAEIPQPGEMEAEIFVLEADAGGLAAGQPARIVLEAHPEATFEATVKRVDKVARPRARRQPVQYFGATLALARTVPEIMKPGQRVRAYLQIERRADVLIVPRQAVFERDGAKVVFRRAGATFQPVRVEIATVSGGEAVVASGLAAGDVLALADPGGAPPAPAQPSAKAGS